VKYSVYIALLGSAHAINQRPVANAMFSTDEDQVDWGFDRRAQDNYSDLLSATQEKEYRQEHHLVQKAEQEIERELAQEKAKQADEAKNPKPVAEKPAHVQV
jgi:hypothetical protein